MEKLVQIYDDTMSLKDHRLANWPLMKNPSIPLSFLFAYVLFIYYGKQYMAKRQAYELKTFMLIYNLLQVIGSFYIFCEVLICAILSKYSLVCQPVDYSNDPLAIRMANVLWFYYITKLIDLIDTVIFVLRKKDNQITFLHVFHHISMVCNSWTGVLFVAGGQSFMLAVLNSFVHSVMYAYYGLSALGPSVQKYLWWKKYITQLQLIQFVLLILHGTVNIFAECTYPKGYAYGYIVYGIIFIGLFSNFYRKSYNEGEGSKDKKNDTRSNGHKKNK